MSISKLESDAINILNNPSIIPSDMDMINDQVIISPGDIVMHGLTKLIISCYDWLQECDAEGNPLDELTFDERLKQKIEQLEISSVQSYCRMLICRGGL